MSLPDNLPTPTVARFELRVRMDATITVHDATGQATDWLKPGSEAACFWNGMPSQEELVLRYNDLTTAAKATLQDLIEQSQKRLASARRGER